MIPAEELGEQAAKMRVGREVVEQDYALSWILWAIAHHAPLAAAVAFKGGTALKKIFFGQYRFSEDLDFGMLRQALRPTKLRPAINAMLAPLRDACGMETHLRSFDTTRDEYGCEVFRIVIGYGWPGIAPHVPGPRVKLDLHYRGGVVEAPVPRHVIHPYSDASDFEAVEVATCTLEEIVAEKLRAMALQSAIGTPRPRDYYDVDRILETLSRDLDRRRLAAVFEEKLHHPVEVGFHGVSDLFPAKHLDRCRVLWDAQVSAMAPDADSFDAVIERLRALLPSWLGR